MSLSELLTGYERPLPPPELHELGLDPPQPAMELAQWIKAVFLTEGGPLFQERHRHLMQADIACLWTNVEYVEGFMPVAATAELVRVSGKPWQRMMTADYLCMLFGKIPTHILKFYAPAAIRASDATFCRRTNHELCHCAQKLNKEKLPAFDDDGKPIWAMRDHEVGVFIDDVALFGLDACHENVRLLVEAAGRPPLIPVERIEAACGYCGGKF